MANPIIETVQLTKHYGTARGIEDVSLTVQPGEIFGFLGPNGAGKTTAIRLLLDLLRPTSGTARIFGLDSHDQSLEIRERVGYLPGEMTLYENMTGAELLHYYAALRRMVDWNLVDQLADRLSCDLSRPIGTLSQGNKRKVGLIQAFMHRPELLILDEATAGLDPLIQHAFLELITEASTSGQTVFLSSHNLAEVERICDRVGMIRGGTLIAVEPIDDLKARAMRTIEITFSESIDQATFSQLDGVQNLVIEGNTLTCNMTGSLDPLIKAAAGYTVIDLISTQPNLEEIFMTFYIEEETPPV